MPGFNFESANAVFQEGAASFRPPASSLGSTMTRPGACNGEFFGPDSRVFLITCLLVIGAIPRGLLAQIPPEDLVRTREDADPVLVDRIEYMLELTGATQQVASLTEPLHEAMASSLKNLDPSHRKKIAQGFLSSFRPHLLRNWFLEFLLNSMDPVLVESIIEDYEVEPLKTIGFLSASPPTREKVDRILNAVDVLGRSALETRGIIIEKMLKNALMIENAVEVNKAIQLSILRSVDGILPAGLRRGSPALVQAVREFGDRSWSMTRVLMLLAQFIALQEVSRENLLWFDGYLETKGPRRNKCRFSTVQAPAWQGGRSA